MAQAVMTLQLTQLDATRVHALTIQSPTGQPQGSFIPPFTGPDESQAVALALEAIQFELSRWQQVGGAFQALKTLGLGDDQGFHQLREQVGRALYDALFPPGGLREALRATLNAGKPGDPARLELRFDANAARLGAYPWELLYDDVRGFLFAKSSAALIRYITCELPVPELVASDALSLLLVTARPIDPLLAPLADTESRAIETGLSAANVNGRIRVSPLASASPAASTWDLLSDYLITHKGDQAPHIFHFDGHGGFGRRCAPAPEGCGVLNLTTEARCRACQRRLDASAQGYLAFERRDRKPHWVSAEELGSLLWGAEVRLAVLTACKSAVMAGQSVFSGMGPALIQAGIPAVAAMQFSVTADAAKQFTRLFYLSLGQYAPLTLAMGQARTALFATPTAWYRPVLYLRADDANPNGQIFVRPPAPQPPVGNPRKPAPLPTAPPSPAPVNSVELMRRILRNLEDTQNAFQAQKTQRNLLAQRMQARFGIREHSEYEAFFFRYYDRMEDDERFEYLKIRGLTQGILQERNRDTLRILDENPSLLDILASLHTLRQHLAMWINKYDQVFTQTPKMCLLYVGVEDGVPFPKGIEAEIEAWLQAPTDSRTAAVRVPPMLTMDKRSLRLVLEAQFNLDELKTLCAEIQSDLEAAGSAERLDLESFGGESKSGKARELVAHLDRRGLLAYLEAALRRARPGEL